MKLDINDTVLVQLTDDGLDRFCQHHAAVGRFVGDVLQNHFSEKSDWYKFTLRELMLVFGPAMTHDDKDVFVNNVIKIKSD